MFSVLVYIIGYIEINLINAPKISEDVAIPCDPSEREKVEAFCFCNVYSIWSLYLSATKHPKIRTSAVDNTSKFFFNLITF